MSNTINPADIPLPPSESPCTSSEAQGISVAPIDWDSLPPLEDFQWSSFEGDIQNLSPFCLNASGVDVPMATSDPANMDFLANSSMSWDYAPTNNPPSSSFDLGQTSLYTQNQLLIKRVEDLETKY
ncbi:uncharacterized protein JN550_004213 [Neoarthrinium moseri]|uniref:uncharacterized protein n=1 Tax=Neoarthrinium moseri TaxID=1658444 RepID=UPI001FDC29D2|nr:uncharacterized protein JN550_004213 [Neoarthrinium moseri]KAI1872010.1 hypothetical protein JN550_004213 [Neoarthrinium moseri]